MYAISFDLTVSEIKKYYPKAVSRAYLDIQKALARNGFAWKQGSLYINPDGGLVELYTAMNDLKALPWFPGSVREVRAFRLENNSGFTRAMQPRS